MTREEAIEELKILKEEYWDDDGYGNETEQYDDTMTALDMAIKALEPVTPKPKMGRLIDDGQYAEGHSEHACRCSKCGYTYIGYTDEYKECQNCGAKMEGDKR